MNTFSIPPLIMAGIASYLALTHFIYFLILPPKDRRLHLIFALLALGITLYDILQAQIYSATSFEQGIPLQAWQFLIIGPVTILIFLLVFEFLELPWKRCRPRLDDFPGVGLTRWFALSHTGF